MNPIEAFVTLMFGFVILKISFERIQQNRRARKRKEKS